MTFRGIRYSRVVKTILVRTVSCCAYTDHLLVGPNERLCEQSCDSAIPVPVRLGHRGEHVV